MKLKYLWRDLLIIAGLLAITLAVLPIYNHAGADSHDEFFESEEALQTWVDNYMATNDSYTYNGVTAWNPDCDDYSLAMQTEADFDGYNLSECPVSRNGLIFGYTRVRAPSLDGNSHVGLWTRIGNNFYYIEPETGEIKKISDPVID